MFKKLFFVLVILITLAPFGASAWEGGCIIFPYNLNLGDGEKAGPTAGEVKRLQTYLRDEGYYSGTISGFYGFRTYNAVMAFQLGNGLEQTGSVGTETKNAIFTLSCWYGGGGGDDPTGYFSSQTWMSGLIR